MAHGWIHKSKEVEFQENRYDEEKGVNAEKHHAQARSQLPAAEENSSDLQKGIKYIRGKNMNIIVVYTVKKITIN